MRWNASRAGMVVGALVALVPALAVWGFTVDDALISVRYAQHLADGVGWRFDADAAPSDGVTPLPWPLLLAPLARHADALAVLDRARVLGLAAWCAAAAAWGATVMRAEAPRRAKALAFAALAVCLPCAAHAVTGMETPVATALATAAAVLLVRGRSRAAAASAGLFAALRPEGIAWALVVGAGGGLQAGGDAAARARRSVLGAAIALAPFAVCAAARAIAFGRALPLAVLAKPSDPAQGLAYAAAAAFTTLAPILLLAPRGLLRAPSTARVLAGATLAHFAALAVAGGDWMPYARLAAPVAPSALLAMVVFDRSRAALAVRGAVALALGAVLFATLAPDARGVLRNRRALVSRARPVLADAHRIASLDVGWVSAAAPDAHVIDLAGVTDPAIAALPGSHTSKHVDPRMLLDLRPDVLLLYAETAGPVDLDQWRRARFPRALESWLARDPTIDEAFVAIAWLPLPPRAGYVVLARAR